MNFFAELDEPTRFYITVCGLFLAGMLLISATIKIAGFNRDLEYINAEIRRTTGHEREHWKRRRRRLWLSLLPFYRG